MPYILVLCLIDKKTYEKSFDEMTTYIDYNAGHGDGSLLMTMSRLSETRVDADSPEFPHCTYLTCQPLYEVLLKQLGNWRLLTNLLEQTMFLYIICGHTCKQRIEFTTSKDKKQLIYGLLRRCITLLLVWIILSFLYFLGITLYKTFALKVAKNDTNCPRNDDWGAKGVFS